MKVFIDSGRDHVLTKRMLPYWKKMGIELVSLREAQIHLSYVQFTKESKIPKVLRLDGFYYDIGRGGMNIPIDQSLRLADGVIYQSGYSELMSKHYLLYPGYVNSTLIYNGGDPTWNDPKDHENFNIVVASNWRRWKRLPEMVDAVVEMQQTYPKIQLHIVGRSSTIIRQGNIHRYGDLTHDDMRTLYRKMDLAIHIAKREWCPNVVLEFLSAGIPTLVSDKGCGAVELLDLIDTSLIVQDDEDSNPVEEVHQYSEAWNSMTQDFKTNLQSKIQMVMHYGPKRVELPRELTAEYAAEKYYKFMEGFI